MVSSQNPSAMTLFSFKVTPSRMPFAIFIPPEGSYRSAPWAPLVSPTFPKNVRMVILAKSGKRYDGSAHAAGDRTRGGPAVRSKREVEPIIRRYNALKTLYLEHGGTSIASWLRDRETAPEPLDKDVERRLLDLIALKYPFK